MDLLVVGCGLRATGLLTSTPALFDHDIGVVEAAGVLGVGSFRHYDIESNSRGSDFFGWIDPAGRFGPLLEEGPVRSLREHTGAFHLNRLAEALDCAGRAIAALLPPERLFLDDDVMGVDIRPDGTVRAHTRSRRLRARTVVLAAGIRERASAELRPWRAKVVRSGALIRPEARERCAELGGGPGLVCFVGASHSAFSVLNRMLARRPAGAAEIVLVSRSPVKIHYTDLAEYRRTPHTSAEAVPDTGRDICPETGNVHRYSGLRNTSKALFHAVAHGRLPGVRLVLAPEPQDRAPYFGDADVLVQAAGYGSNLPEITVDGQAVDCLTSGSLVRIDERGRLCTDGGVLRPVFVMGMDPYPYDDNSINPTNQYVRRGRNILGRLSECRMPRNARDTTPMRRVLW